MSKFFDPKTNGDNNGGIHDDARLYAPATARNRNVIRSVLENHLQDLTGTLIEVASGTGEHAVHIAPHLPHITWQPTDIEEKHLLSINAWRTHDGSNNIKPAQYFNIIDDRFSGIEGGNICAIAAINLIHIAPWAATEHLIEKSSDTLYEGGVLFLYGPYKRGGEHTSASNADFDQSLKSRNPDWGIRDLEAVTAHAARSGFQAPNIIQMPANNLSLIFRKM